MSNDKSSYLDWFVHNNTNNTSGAFKIEKQAEEKWSRDTVLSLQTPVKLLSVAEMNSLLTKLINGASAFKHASMLYFINHEKPTYLTFWKETLLLFPLSPDQTLYLCYMLSVVLLWSHTIGLTNQCCLWLILFTAKGAAKGGTMRVRKVFSDMVSQS